MPLESKTLILTRILPVWHLVHRAPNALRSLVQDVGVIHGCFYVLVSMREIGLLVHTLGRIVGKPSNGPPVGSFNLTFR